MNSSTMKLSVRISDLDWERLRSERTKIRATLRDTLEDLSQEERKAIRKPIEILLKGVKNWRRFMRLIMQRRMA
jgi:hypothetical protein